jgi:hypothetical protein
LNLPRALVTEKAFPENELVISTAASASGAPAWTTDVIDERTIIDARTQLEIDVPVNYADQGHVGSFAGAAGLDQSEVRQTNGFHFRREEFGPRSHSGRGHNKNSAGDRFGCRPSGHGSAFGVQVCA